MRQTFLPAAAEAVQRYKAGDVRIWRSMSDILKAIVNEEAWVRRTSLDPELCNLPARAWGIAVELPDSRAPIFVCWHEVRTPEGESVAEVIYVGIFPPQPA
jgi:hypothetical protein